MQALVVREMMFSSNKKNEPCIFLNEEIRSRRLVTTVITSVYLTLSRAYFERRHVRPCSSESAAARMPANHYVTSVGHF